MVSERLPSYVNRRKLANGTVAYYWSLPTWAKPPARRHGHICPVESKPLGADLPDAIVEARRLNEAFTDWRKGEVERVSHGTVRWLFAWYRDHERFTGKAYKTRKGYLEAMTAVDAIALKSGTFGVKRAAAVDATAADIIYRLARTKHGERQGSYMMQVCRLVWNQARRHAKTTGITNNPFAAMGIRSKSGQGNRAATRAEYDAYRAAARAIGRPSMAVAAALLFEGCQRVWDAFGFVDPDTKVPSRGINWRDYVPGERLGLIQSKTGNAISIPLSMTIDGEAVALYPELEAELASMERREDGGLIVRDDRSGKPYSMDYYSKLHARIRKAAGLPADLRVTSFRHGGITEIGDAGESDMRAVTGHRKLDTTAIYNKASQAQAVRIAAKRREHVALITAGEGENEP